jgi:hypothetical protein
VATEDPRTLVLGVLLQENVQRVSSLLISALVGADLRLGHQVAHRVLVLDVSKGNARSAIDLPHQEEVN